MSPADDGHTDNGHTNDVHTDDGQVDPLSSWQEVEHWFHEALDWPRDQWLSQLHQHDVKESVIDEVVSLLEAAETPGGFSETSPHVLAVDWTERHETSASGQRITTYCDQHRLDLRRRLRLFLEICRHVERDHGLGRLHGDLRPSNIRLSGDPHQPRLEILGLESSTACDGQGMKEKAHGSRQRGGHPEYASPEAISGGGAAMDIRSDIYSLGVVLWELMIGLRPFSGGQLLHLTDLSTDTTLLAPPSLRFQRIAKEPREFIAEVRQRDSRSLLRDLRPDLDWIALRATHLDPSQRYPSMGELAADVESWLNGRRAPSRPASFLGRFGESLRRRFGGKR